MDKNVRKKKLQRHLSETKDMIAVVWVMLILEALILLILYPNFIPVDWLSRALAAVQTFFRQILWPAGEADFVDKTYRYYIYKVVTWVKDWPEYPKVVLPVRCALPLLQCIQYVYLGILRLCLATVERERAPRQSKQPKPIQQPKQPKEPRGTLVSGMLPSEAAKASKYLEQLRSRHPKLPEKDMGLWIGNQPITDMGTVEPDRLLPWQNGEIVYDMGARGKLVFKLVGTQAYLETEKGPMALTVGEPVVISYVNAAKEKVMACTATWLGGF